MNTEYKEIQLTSDRNNTINLLKNAVTKMRMNGHCGSFNELAMMPILEFSEVAYNYDMLIKNMPEIELRFESIESEKQRKLLRIKKKIEYKQVALSPTSLASTNTSMLRLTKSNNNEEQLIVIFENWSQKERAAFFIGTRLAKHNSAKQLNMFIEMITTMAETMDEHENNYVEPLE
jgi:hypothetical protein